MAGSGNEGNRQPKFLFARILIFDGAILTCFAIAVSRSKRILSLKPQIAQDSNRGAAPLAIRCTSDKTCWGRSHSMELGIYHEFPLLPGRSQAECFAAGFDIVDAGEEYGLDVIWLAELHFDKRRALAASPLVRGPRSRPAPKGLGSGPACKCFRWPIRFASPRKPTLDHVSKGRLIFGVGRSGVVKTYEALN